MPEPNNQYKTCQHDGIKRVQITNNIIYKGNEKYTIKEVKYFCLDCGTPLEPTEELQNSEEIRQAEGLANLISKMFGLP